MQVHGWCGEQARWGWKDQGCGSADVGFSDRQQARGLFGLGPPPDARDIEIAVLPISYFDLE
jgi:hypothetical protein